MSKCIVCKSADTSHYCEECRKRVCEECQIYKRIWVSDFFRGRNSWWCQDCIQLYHKCHRCVNIVAKTETYYCVPCNILTGVKYPLCGGCCRTYPIDELESEYKPNIGGNKCCAVVYSGRVDVNCLEIEVNRFKQKIETLEHERARRKQQERKYKGILLVAELAILIGAVIVLRKRWQQQSEQAAANHKDERNPDLAMVWER